MKLKRGLGLFMSSGQKTDRACSPADGAHTGLETGEFSVASKFSSTLEKGSSKGRACLECLEVAMHNVMYYLDSNKCRRRHTDLSILSLMMASTSTGSLKGRPRPQSAMISRSRP